MNQKHQIQRSQYGAAVKMATVLFICLFSLTIIMFASGCGSHATKVPTISSKNDWQEAGLKGKVKSYQQFDVSFSDSLDRIILESTPPQLVESKQFFPSGHISSYYDGYYTQAFSEFNGGKIEGNTNLKGQTQSNYTAYYDQEGRLQKIEGMDNEDNSWIHVYQYDGNAVEISSHDPAYENQSNSFTIFDKYKWKHVEKYNKHGKVIESVHYGSFGEIQWSEKFRYDSWGNKTFWIRYDSRGSVEWKKVFQYDQKGNELECAEYDPGNNLVRKYIYRYISEGRLNCYANANEKWDFTEILTDCYDPNGSKDYPDSFDAKGNWTIRMTLEPTEESKGVLMKVTKIEKRILEYYTP